MSDDLVEQIKRDRERPQVKRKSLPKWEVSEGRSPGVLEIVGPSQSVRIITTATDLNGEDYVARCADARRIARIPDMEAALIAMSARVAAADALAEVCLALQKSRDAVRRMNSALTTTKAHQDMVISELNKAWVNFDCDLAAYRKTQEETK